MFIVHNPPQSMPLVGPLSWGLEATGPRRMLYVSGQVGADGEGRVAEGFIEQSRLTWANVGAVLASAGMSAANIVRTGIFVVETVAMTPELRESFNALRIGFLGDHRPASTMIYVPALMNPAWLVEIDAVAVEF